MKRILVTVVLIGLWMPSGEAIPNSFIGGRFIGPIVPAHPRFGANLTRPFLAMENWERNEFPGDWENDTALAGEKVSRMTSLPVLFGAVPDSVTAFSEEGRLREMVINYLDAGTYFGFKFGGEKTHADREAGSERRSKFEHHYNLLSRDLLERLEQGCGAGEQAVVGRSEALRTVYTDFRWEDFAIRLARRNGHSISLHLMRAKDAREGFVAKSVAALNDDERRQQLAENVLSNELGDRMIGGIPMFEQGHTPFCGIHTLAMAGHYYGLRLRADELAAGAEFRNTGSARGSRILDLYHSVGDELDMKVRVSSRFDFEKIQKSVSEGMPVIVWRRVSKERENAHPRVATGVSLPVPTKSDRASWPDRGKKGSPSHASIVSGFNAERNEVIFTDPWGEKARDRKMRAEEMEATAYAVFFFSL